MKRLNWIGWLSCGLALMGIVSASERPAAAHRIVFELTSGGDKQYEAILNNLENTLKALGPGTRMFVIAHGPGLGLVLKENARFSERMEKLHGPNLAFAACENTLRTRELTKEDLLPFVTTVDSGVAEVVRRQSDGWIYIKSGH
jgi:uncharacterized protein